MLQNLLPDERRTNILWEGHNAGGLEDAELVEDIPNRELHLHHSLQCLSVPINEGGVVSPNEEGMVSMSVSPSEMGVASAPVSLSERGMPFVPINPIEGGVASVPISPSEGGMAYTFYAILKHSVLHLNNLICQIESLDV